LRTMQEKSSEKIDACRGGHVREMGGSNQRKVTQERGQRRKMDKKYAFAYMQGAEKIKGRGEGDGDKTGS